MIIIKNKYYYIIGVLFIIISFLQAETYYVDINSSCPTPDGSLECPYLKIQEALNNVQQGDIGLF